MASAACHTARPCCRVSAARRPYHPRASARPRRWAPTSTSWTRRWALASAEIRVESPKFGTPSDVFGLVGCVRLDVSHGCPGEAGASGESWDVNPADTLVWSGRGPSVTSARIQTQHHHPLRYIAIYLTKCVADDGQPASSFVKGASPSTPTRGIHHPGRYSWWASGKNATVDSHLMNLIGDAARRPGRMIRLVLHSVDGVLGRGVRRRVGSVFSRRKMPVGGASRRQCLCGLMERKNL